MKRISIPVILVLVALSGCMSLTEGFDAAGLTQSGDSPPSSRLQPITGMANNATVRLESGRYRGGTIGHDSVTILGEGVGRTIITGTVRISGNNCVIRNLTIDGNVIIQGENADLTRVEISGRVESSGKNNRW